MKKKRKLGDKVNYKNWTKEQLVKELSRLNQVLIDSFKKIK